MATFPDDQMRLSVKIKNHHPVELVDFARGVLALGDEYRNFMAGRNVDDFPESVKLYVREVRTGSIEVDLVALATASLGFVDQANSVLEFASRLKQTMDWLLGREQGPPPLVDKKELENIQAFVEPIAKDSNAGLHIEARDINGQIVVNYHINSTESSAIQNNARREMKKLASPETGIRPEVVMFWAQAKNQAAGVSSGDRAIIESIYPKPVKVRFADDAMRARTLFDQENPFLKAYLVDVDVQTVNGKPVLYKVLGLHDVLSLEDL